MRLEREGVGKTKKGGENEVFLVAPRWWGSLPCLLLQVTGFGLSVSAGPSTS